MLTSGPRKSPSTCLSLSPLARGDLTIVPARRIPVAVFGATAVIGPAKPTGLFTSGLNRRKGILTVICVFFWSLLQRVRICLQKSLHLCTMQFA
jgi:hypothetical protein